ncbi:MAG: ROK family protein [Desulfobacteraceae bacterium]|nr:ROK family protein [Desulfobacteraceae bacterium]
MMKIAVGIDIGGTNTKIGLVDQDGSLLDFQTFPTTGPDNFNEYTNKVKKTVLSLLDGKKIDYTDIIGIGVGAPNGNGKTGCIENPPNIKHWGTVNLVTPFSKVLNKKIVLENDANVAAIGEGKWGVAKGLDHFIVVTLGTGIGSGIVSHGKLLSGSNGLASEGGHIMIEKNGRNCGCGGRGHLEDYCSVRGIKLTAKEITGEDLTFREISERFHNNDPQMVKVFEQTAEYLGHGLSIMGTLFSPEAIILAGGVATIGEKLRFDVEKNYNKFVFSAFKGTTKILVSEISTAEGAVIGAASLVL